MSGVGEGGIGSSFLIFGMMKKYSSPNVLNVTKFHTKMGRMAILCYMHFTASLKSERSKCLKSCNKNINIQRLKNTLSTLPWRPSACYAGLPLASPSCPPGNQASPASPRVSIFFADMPVVRKFVSCMALLKIQVCFPHSHTLVGE